MTGQFASIASVTMNLWVSGSNVSKTLYAIIPISMNDVNENNNYNRKGWAT